MPMSLTRRQLLSTAGAALASAPSRPPNVVLILADDLGYGDLGAYGQKTIRTPNLDRMAAEGLRFTQSYAGSTVCAPSRCCLITGRHTGHATVRGNEEPHVPLGRDEPTIAQLFQRAGYRTGAFGKWGLGTPPDTYALPTRKGFDEFFGYYHQVHAHSYFPDMLWDNEREHYMEPNFAGGRKIYSHDRIAGRALEFIDRNHDRPFFLYAPFTPPHGRFEVPDARPYQDADWPPVFRNIASMITRLDATVGAIVERIERYGLGSNTLVLFNSDNGPGGLANSRFHSSGPLRGIKRDMYEGGMRVPLIARWKGTVAPGVSDHVCASWDFLPTMAELLRASPVETDGISMAPTLLGTPTKQRRHEYLYWECFERGFQQAVRADDWKAVRLKPGAPPELYNLAEDLGETRDVAEANPAVVKRMEEILRTCRTKTEKWG